MGDDRRLSNILFAGFVLLLLGGVGSGFMFLATLSFGAGAYIAAGIFGILFLGGLGLLIYGLATGLGFNRRMGRVTDIRPISGATVVARFAENEIGDTVFSDFDPEGAKLYVRLAVPGGRSLELRTSAEVWHSAGEGMLGTAYVQGDWLGRFERSPLPHHPS